MFANPRRWRIRVLGPAILLLAAALPTAHAQAPGKPIRVGVLLSGSATQWAPFESELVAGLRDQGYVEAGISSSCAVTASSGPIA